MWRTALYRGALGHNRAKRENEFVSKSVERIDVNTL